VRGERREKRMDTSKSNAWLTGALIAVPLRSAYTINTHVLPVDKNISTMKWAEATKGVQPHKKTYGLIVWSQAPQ